MHLDASSWNQPAGGDGRAGPGDYCRRPTRWAHRAPALLVALGLACACAAQAPLPDPLEAGWKGEKVCQKLHEDAQTRILRCTFPPGVGHERHFHGPHFAYVVAGGRIRLTDAAGTREVDLVTGDGSFSEGVAWHEGVNIGDSTIVFLIVESKRRSAE